MWFKWIHGQSVQKTAYSVVENNGIAYEHLNESYLYNTLNLSESEEHLLHAVFSNGYGVTKFTYNTLHDEIAEGDVGDSLSEESTVVTPEDETEETEKPDDSKEEIVPLETEEPVVGENSENEETSADSKNSMLPIIGIGAVIIAIGGFVILRKRKSE